MFSRMHHGILVLCSLIFISHSINLPFKSQTKQYLKIRLSKANKSSPLYFSMITGDKSKLSFKLKKKLKQMGLLHLFTPSGLHLSSFFFLRFLPKKILLGIFFLLFLWLSTYFCYSSMERVIIFKIIHLVLKERKIETHFFLTFIFSFLLGQYREPLSFLYSFLFWGTIIIFRNNPIKGVFYLSFQNLILNSLTGLDSNILLFILNPIITLLTTAIFPLFFFNAILPESIELNLSGYFRILEYILNSTPLFFLVNINFLTLLAIFIGLKIGRLKALIALLLIIPQPIAKSWRYQQPKKVYIPPGIYEDVIDSYEFIDRRCDEYLNCRRIKTEFGGFKI